MTRATLYLVDAPAPSQIDRPDPDGFRDKVEAMVTLTRRSADHRPNQEQLQRFVVLAAAISRIARRIGEPIAHLDLADLVDPADDTWLGPVIPAAQATAWLARLVERTSEQTRPVLDAAIRKLDSNNVSLVAVLGEGGPAVSAPAPATSGAREQRVPLPETAALLADPPLEFPAFAEDAPRRRSAERWARSVVDAVATGQPVVVSGLARHHVIAEVLRAVCGRITKQTELRVMYVDGSEADPIDLVPVPSPLDAAHAPLGRQLTLGLLSMRHTELDPEVDGYWFRNRFVSTGDLRADIDRRCTQLSLERLDELEQAGIERISLIHTGFEPAALALYRALMRWQAGGGRMIIEPWYLRAGDLAPLSAWGGVR